MTLATSLFHKCYGIMPRLTLEIRVPNMKFVALTVFKLWHLTLQLSDLPFRCAHIDAQSAENSISANSLRSLGGDNYRQGSVTSMNVIKLN